MLLRHAHIQAEFARANQHLLTIPEGPERTRVGQDLAPQLEVIYQNLTPDFTARVTYTTGAPKNDR